jgi:TolB protein
MLIEMMRLIRFPLALAAVLFIPWQSQAADPDTCWLAYAVQSESTWELWLAHPNSEDRSLSQNESGFDIALTRAWAGGQAVFSSTRDGNWELYRVEITSDGISSPQRLTTTAEVIELDPAFSPDDRLVSFDANPNGNWDIYTLDLTSNQVTRLTDHPANDINAAWSPDGASLIFQSDRAEGVWGLYRLELSSGQVRPFSTLQGDFDAAFSPDGSQAVFRSARDSADGESSSLYLIPAAGGIETRFSPLGQDSLYPVWSPDGRWIAYQSALRNRRYAIYLYEVATEQTYQVTAFQEGQSHEGPAWDCTGEQLIFAANPNGDFDLYQRPLADRDTFPASVNRQTQVWRTGPGDQRDPFGYPNEENATRRGTLPPPISIPPQN